MFSPDVHSCHIQLVFSEQANIAYIVALPRLSISWGPMHFSELAVSPVRGQARIFLLYCLRHRCRLGNKLSTTTNPRGSRVIPGRARGLHKCLRAMRSWPSGFVYLSGSRLPQITMLLSLAFVSSLVASAVAHATFQELWINGVDQGLLEVMSFISTADDDSIVRQRLRSSTAQQLSCDQRDERCKLSRLSLLLSLI